MSPIACGGDRRGSTPCVVESKTVGRVRCSGSRCTGEKPVLFDTPTFLVYRGKSSATALVFECDGCWRSGRIRMGRKSRDFLTQVFHWAKHATNAGVTRRYRESCPGARLVGLVFQTRRGGARLIRWARCVSSGAHRRPCVAGVTPWPLGQRCPGVGWQSQHIAFLGWFPSSCRKVSPVLARPSDAGAVENGLRHLRRGESLGAHFGALGRSGGQQVLTGLLPASGGRLTVNATGASAPGGSSAGG